LVIIFLINKFLGLKESVVINIIGKFSNKNDNVLSNRDEIWSQAIDNTKFFGNGAHFFQEEIGLGSHNSFLSLLGTYGFIPTLCIISIFVIAFYNVVKYSLKSKSKYNYVGPLVIVTFLTLSMAEDMNWKLSIIVSLILAGHAMNKRKVTIIK